MILADTSIWIDHLRRSDAGLVALLLESQVLVHPWVIGELACGNLRDRKLVLDLLRSLPVSPVANTEEVLFFIEKHALMGQGIGYVDVHLLAAARLAGTRLWTRDRRLVIVADELGMGYADIRH